MTVRFLLPSALALAVSAGAQPVPRSLQPAAVTAGGPGFTLLVSGQAFTAGTRIVWDGSALPTRFEAESVLAADIPASRIGKPGPVAVALTRSEGVSEALTLTVNPALEWITQPILPAAAYQQFFAQVLGVSGGTPPVRFALASGVVPPGLHLDGYNGAVVGYATAVGQYSLSVRATDASGASAVQLLRLTVAGELRVAGSGALPSAIAGQPYTAQFGAEGGIAPMLEWKVSSGALPRGLVLDEKTGRISGTPAIGTAQFTVRVRDSGGKTAIRAMLLEVRAPLSIAAPGLLTGFAEGDPVDLKLEASGGTAPYVWSLEGEAPPGLVFDSAAGILRGALEAQGTYRMALRVRDAAGGEARSTLELPVAPKLEPIPPSLQRATVGSPFSVTLAARGGGPPYAWSLVEGQLPVGFRFEAGRLEGTPRAEGEFTLTTEVRDRAQRTARTTIRLQVTPPPLPELQLGPLARLEPGQQAKLHFRIDRAYPLDLDLTVQIGFEGPPDPAVLLSTGGRQTRVAIRAGQLVPASPLQLQTGTTAGLIAIEASLGPPGRTASAPLLERATVDPAPPQIRSIKSVKTADGFDIIVTVISSTREIESALFAFDNAQQLTIPLRQITSAWYADERSVAFGTLLTYRQNFTVRGDISRLRGLSMTVTNGIGPSLPASVAF